VRSILCVLLLVPCVAFGALEAPLWFDGSRPAPAAYALVRELQHAQARGLRPQDYDASNLSARLQAFPSSASHEAVLAIDGALSAAAARIAMDLRAGRVDPRRLGHDLDVPRAREDPAPLVAQLAWAQDVGRALDRLEPRLKQYALLKAALARYRNLETRTELARLPALPQPSLRTGDVYAGAGELRALLLVLGDLEASSAPASSTQPPVFDQSLERGIRRFQSRHGLDSDGVLGRATFRELTVPFSRRIEQIELSLERIRWLPAFESPPIVVNIPQFRLFAFRTNEDLPDEILQMDVVVGSAFEPRHTPVFAAQMSYLVLRPYWDVPRSILLEELLPPMRRDPRWLEANGYEIVLGQGDDATPQPASPQNIELLARGKLRVRQKPGPANALGLVKFMLPNAHNIYLHDTPARALFSRSRRDFSHGCIRVSDPMALIRYVLGDDPQWPTERIQAAMQSGGPTRIPLPRRIPVFVLYGTALVRSTGETLFFDDVYGHDARLQAAIASRPH
jgi:murein L,D-transpeptidase YcbB/YkuD